jgi:hypothetical protein
VPRGRVRQPKNAQILIDREQSCPVDPATLPHDAEYKGTVAVIVQDLALRRNLAHLPWDSELDEPALNLLLDAHVSNAGPTPIWELGST